MIWLAIVAAVFVVGGSWFVAKTLSTRILVGVAGLAAVGTYWVLGKPDMADRPLDVRLAEIEERLKTAPETLDEREAIALAERRVREQPNESRALVLIGQMYESLATRAQQQGMAAMQAGNEAEANRQAAMIQDSIDKAIDAYTRAIRRNEVDIEAITNLADLRFKSTSEVDAFTSQLYQAAFSAQPDQFRLGYMAGIGLWLQGKVPEAEAIWADIDARAPQDGPERQMFAALRQMFGIDKGVPPGPSDPSPN